MFNKFFALLVVGLCSASAYALVGDVVGAATGAAREATATGQAAVGAATDTAASTVGAATEGAVSPGVSISAEEPTPAPVPMAEAAMAEKGAPALEKGKAPAGGVEIDIDEIDLSKVPTEHITVPSHDEQCKCPATVTPVPAPEEEFDITSEDLGEEATPRGAAGFEDLE
jgi:hypothetical protein